MLITLILGIAAGFGASRAERHVRQMLTNTLLSDPPITPLELRLFSFALCLLAAGVLAALLGDGSAVDLALGAVLGVFAPRAIASYRSR